MGDRMILALLKIIITSKNLKILSD